MFKKIHEEQSSVYLIKKLVKTFVLSGKYRVKMVTNNTFHTSPYQFKKKKVRTKQKLLGPYLCHSLNNSQWVNVKANTRCLRCCFSTGYTNLETKDTISSTLDDIMWVYLFKSYHLSYYVHFARGYITLGGLKRGILRDPNHYPFYFSSYISPLYLLSRLA